MQSRAATRDAPTGERPDPGFSLIELIAVVAVIGVLAAIAIPTFLGVQARAADASVQSDLVHAKTALTAFAVGHDGGAPSAVSRSGAATWSSTAVDLVPLGWTLGSSTADLAYTPGSGSSWCLLATSATGSTFRVTPSTGVARATSCP